MTRILDRMIECGLVLLFIWTPLAFGAVHAWAYALLASHVFLLTALWLLRRMIGALARFGADQRPLVLPLATLPFALFCGLLLFQLWPLPHAFLTQFSPATVDLLHQFLPRSADATLPLSLLPYETRLALGKLLAYACVFVLIINTVRSQRRIITLMYAIVGTASAIAFIGLLQGFSGATAIYWLRDTQYAGSFFGSYINRNHFAGYQSMAIFLGLALLLSVFMQAQHDVSSAWRHRLLRLFRFVTPSRLLLLCMLSVMTGALFLSASRGGVISYLIGLLSFGLLLGTSRMPTGRRAVWAVASTAMIGMALWLGMTPLLNRFAHVDQDVMTWAERLPAFQAAWHIGRDFPLFGVGFEAFQAVSPRYQPAALSQNKAYFYAHNDYLQLLAETGWMGLTLLLSGFLLVFTAIIRQWRRRDEPFVRVTGLAGLMAALTMGLHALVDFNLHIPANALLFTGLVALTYACVHLPGRRDGQDSPVLPRRWTTVSLSGLGVLAMLGLTYSTLRVVIADRYYPQQDVLQPSHWIYRVDPEAKRDRLQHALRWTPENPYYEASLAAVALQMAIDKLDAPAHAAEAQAQAITDLQRAVLHYDRALPQRPLDPSLHLGRLQATQALNRLQPEAMALSEPMQAARYRRIATLAPYSPEMHYQLGLLRLYDPMENGAAVTPQSFFQQARQLDATYDDRILQLYLNRYPLHRALHQFATTVPNTAESHVKSARLVERWSWPSARLHYRAALILSQYDADILKVYGTALQRHKDFPAARELWQQLQVHAPLDARAYLGLADALQGLGDHEGALRSLQSLVEHFPRDAAYRIRLAQAYMQLEQVAEAEAAWRRAIELQPHRPEGYAGLARIYTSQGDGSSAIPMWRQAAGRAPDNFGYHRELARLYERMGKRDQAQRVYLQLASRQSDHPQVYYHLGSYAQQDGQILQAIQYYRRAAQLKPDDINYQKALERALKLSTK